MASMDLSSLVYLLSNSLSHQEQHRKEAEAQLEHASAGSGFALLLLQVATVAGHTEPAVRQAAAIYFKNMINKRYDPYDESKVQPLGEDEKAQIRQSIVAVVVNSPALIRPQLVASVHKVIRADFPKRWPNLVEELVPLITSGDNERVISSLTIFHEVVSWHGATATDGSRDVIFGGVFPLLLSIIQARLDAAAHLDRDSIVIVKSILKSFYASIQFRFSTHLLLGDAFSAWCTIITHVIQLSPPEDIIALSKEEAEAHHYWKMKKWAVRIHNKIFQRYGCAKLDTFNNPDNMSFATFYMDQIVLPVLSVYLDQIHSNMQGKNPFNERIFCLLLDFLESAIRHKKTWSILEKDVMNLISFFLFPRMCFLDEDQEMWDEDPEEYVRVKLDPFDELYSAHSSSVNFILDLVKCRKKVMFVPVLTFINEILSNPSSDLDTLRRKDGAFFMVGSLSRVLMNSDFKAQAEPVISLFVLPQLACSHGFLRLRACWVIEQFEDLEYSEGTCLNALHGVLTCLDDKDLPVKVAAAGALATLLDNETSQKALPPYLGKVMESMLTLANEIQLDSIAFVLQRLVQMFSDDLAPYAVQLCRQLRDTVARSLEGYSNVLDVDADDESFGQNADKMMAAVGMFKAIETLIDSMSKTPDLLHSLEETVLPLLAMVMDRRIIDLYDETFEMIDSITYSRKLISHGLWNLFPYIYRTFKDVGADYIQDMETTLDNFISYDSATLLANPSRLEMMLDIIKCTMTEEEFSSHDRVYGCKLMESLMLNCRDHIDAVIGDFVGYVIPTLNDETEDKPAIVVHHLEVIVNALYYNPILALRHLNERNFTVPFFHLWIKKAGKFTRVHDKRLTIMALSCLMLVPFVQLPEILQQNFQHVLSIYLEAIQTLPKALETRKKLEDEDLSDSDFEDDDFASEGDYDEVSDDAETGPAWQSAQRWSRTEETVDCDDEYDSEDFEDELEEELFFETPLDKVDIASVVQQTLSSVAKTQPGFMQVISQSLAPEKATFLHSLIPQ